MKTTVEFPYSQSIDDVFASFVDADFLTQKWKYVDAENITVEVTEYDDGSFDVHTVADVTADVPTALKKLINPKVKMTTTEEWEGQKGGPYTCSVKVEMNGMPAKVSAVNELHAAEDGGCINQATTDMRITIPMGPLMRGTLEKYITKISNEQVQRMYNYMRNNI